MKILDFLTVVYSLNFKFPFSLCTHISVSFSLSLALTRSLTLSFFLSLFPYLTHSLPLCVYLSDILSLPSPNQSMIGTVLTSNAP